MNCTCDTVISFNTELAAWASSPGTKRSIGSQIMDPARINGTPTLYAVTHKQPSEKKQRLFGLKFDATINTTLT